MIGQTRPRIALLVLAAMVAAGPVGAQSPSIVTSSASDTAASLAVGWARPPADSVEVKLAGCLRTKVNAQAWGGWDCAWQALPRLAVARPMPPAPPDTAPTPTPPPAPIPGPVGNEPAGLTVVADLDWVGLRQQTSTAAASSYGPWSRREGAARGFSVVDPAAPLSPHVLEIDFSGIRQGTGPESFQLALPARATELYLRFPVYIPLTYYGSTSGVQKLWHLWSTNDGKPTYLPGGSMMVPAIYGVGTSGLSYQLRVQGASTTATQAISFNISCGGLQRGRWYVLEAYVRQNTANPNGTVNADGVAMGWVDGRLTCARSNLQYSGAAVKVKQWTFAQLNPTYGGTGTAPAGVMLRYGKVRVSAR